MKHLIEDNEAIAILEASGAKPDTVARFARQLGGVLAARKAFGPTSGVTCYSVAGSRTGNPGINIDMDRVTVFDNTVGGIEVHFNDVRLQLDIRSAFGVAHNIIGAAEAAISDVAIYKLLTEHVNLKKEVAGRMLINLREIRQGSRDTVVPQ